MRDTDKILFFLLVIVILVFIYYAQWGGFSGESEPVAAPAANSSQQFISLPVNGANN